MLRKICYILSLAVFNSIIFSFVCHADSSSLFRTAETVEMIENNNVSMVDENVYIKAYSGFSAVSCEFTFKNETDTEQQVLMGFPASLFGIEGDKEIDGTTRLLDFKTFIDGKEKGVLLESAKDIQEEYRGKVAEWYTWDVNFKPGETKRVINTYTARNYSAPWARRAGYILITGAPWKGNIGRAVVTFELMDISPVNIDASESKPEGYKIDKNKVIWEFNSFEPYTDIALALKPGPFIPHILSGYSSKKLEPEPELERKMWDTHQMMILGKYEEGLKQIRDTMDQGIVYEELYFDLLNYYRETHDEDMFIKVLKEQIVQLNSPNIYAWALSVYPDRIQDEGISYPADHRPEIQNEKLTLVDDRHFELTADITDNAGDMIFFNVFAYTEPGHNFSLMDTSFSKSLLGMREYHFKEIGRLPAKFSDMVYRLEVSDSSRNEALSRETLGHRPGETYYFYTGKTLEKWNTRKNDTFTLCYYDQALEAIENELNGKLKEVIGKTVSILELNTPKGGFIINLYNPLHFPNLKTQVSQNITKAFKYEYYNSALHNARIQNRSSRESYANQNADNGIYYPVEDEIVYDWGEILVPADYKDVQKNADFVLLGIMEKYLGSGWRRADREVLKSFIDVIIGTTGEGKYYDVFSKMKPDELKYAANYIGLHGDADKFMPLMKNEGSAAEIKEQPAGKSYTTEVLAMVMIGAAAAGTTALLVLRKRLNKIQNK